MVFSGKFEHFLYLLSQFFFTLNRKNVEGVAGTSTHHMWTGLELGMSSNLDLILIFAMSPLQSGGHGILTRGWMLQNTWCSGDALRRHDFCLQKERRSFKKNSLPNSLFPTWNGLPQKLAQIPTLNGLKGFLGQRSARSRVQIPPWSGRFSLPLWKAREMSSSHLGRNLRFTAWIIAKSRARARKMALRCLAPIISSGLSMCHSDGTPC